MIQKETLFQAPSNPIWGLAGANSTNKFRSFYRCETARFLLVSESISRMVPQCSIFLIPPLL